MDLGYLQHFLDWAQVLFGGEVDPSDKGHAGAGQFSSSTFCLDTVCPLPRHCPLYHPQCFGMIQLHVKTSHQVLSLFACGLIQ